MSNGYTKIPDDILKFLIDAPFNPNHFRLFNLVMQKKYGFREDEFKLGSEYVAKRIDIARSYAVRIIDDFVQARILRIVQLGGGRGKPTIYEFNSIVSSYDTVYMRGRIMSKISASSENIKERNSSHTETVSDFTPNTVHSQAPQTVHSQAAKPSTHRDTVYNSSYTHTLKESARAREVNFSNTQTETQRVASKVIRENLEYKEMAIRNARDGNPVYIRVCQEKGWEY